MIRFCVDAYLNGIHFKIIWWVRVSSFRGHLLPTDDNARRDLAPSRNRNPNIFCSIYLIDICDNWTWEECEACSRNHTDIGITIASELARMLEVRSDLSKSCTGKFTAASDATPHKEVLRVVCLAIEFVKPHAHTKANFLFLHASVYIMYEYAALQGFSGSSKDKALLPQ